LMQMPAGPLAYAVGVSLWRETLVDTPDPLAQQGLIVGDIQQSAVDAKRNAKAFFVELNIPVLKNLEVQTAVRRDIYDTAARTSPKIAARWKALPQLAFRASYTTSFRMPNLKQLYGTQDTGAITLDSDAECAALGESPGCTVPATQVSGGNPELKPEKGKTFNVGAIFDVGRLLSGTLDYWKIQKKDSISTITLDQALAGNLRAMGLKPWCSPTCKTSPKSRRRVWTWTWVRGLVRLPWVRLACAISPLITLPIAGKRQGENGRI